MVEPNRSRGSQMVPIRDRTPDRDYDRDRNRDSDYSRQRGYEPNHNRDYDRNRGYNRSHNRDYDRNFDDRPLVLIWELTQACTLACDHCRAAAEPTGHPDELTTAEGKRLLEQARSFGEGQLVVFSGGDPLKRPDVEELVQYGTDIGLTVTATPSGTASLTRTRLESLVDAGLDRLALSLDGATARAHDAFRSEIGSFADTVAAARHAESLELPRQINTTVCVETVDQLPALRDLVEALGANMWSVFFLVPVGRGETLTSVAPTYADEIMAWLHEVSRSAPFRVKTTEAPQYRRIALQSGATDGPVGPGRRGIIAGDGFAFVSHTGEVYPSGFLPISAGNVRDTPVPTIYRDSSLFTRLRDRDELTGKCGACPYRYRCGGSRSRAYATTGDAFAADPLCPYVPDGYDGPLPRAP